MDNKIVCLITGEAYLPCYVSENACDCQLFYLRSYLITILLKWHHKESFHKVYKVCILTTNQPNPKREIIIDTPSINVSKLSPCEIWCCLSQAGSIIRSTERRQLTCWWHIELAVTRTVWEACYCFYHHLRCPSWTAARERIAAAVASHRVLSVCRSRLSALSSYVGRSCA